MQLNLIIFLITQFFIIFNNRSVSYLIIQMYVLPYLGYIFGGKNNIIKIFSFYSNQNLLYTPLGGVKWTPLVKFAPQNSKFLTEFALI